jgi:uroporphyrinogen decarboxylase
MRDDWGTLLRCPVKQASLPQYLDWPVKSLEDWEKYKESFEGPAEERIPEAWDRVAERIRNQNNGIVAPHIIGLFAFPREIMGVENLMMYFYDAPELIEKVLDDRLEFIFRVYEKPIRDTQPDMAFIWEDMSYKSGPLISPAMCEQYLLPRYKKLTGFFRDLGIKRVVADSDGNVSKLIPIWREGGINGMMPFEVKAGNDIAELAKQWPDMVFFGGIAKMEIAKGNGAIDRELGKRLPHLIGRGGYIAGLDHWVPPEISYEDYRYFRDQVLQYRNGDES